jgi:hypothetical protein
MNQECGDIMDFIYLVFENSPKGANSLRLTLDYSHLTSEEEIDEFTFKQLLNIFIAGCKLRYGEVVLLEEMKGERLQIMNLYFNSFGYKLFVNEIEEGIQFMTRGEKVELKDYYLKINRNRKNYYIYFDDLNKEE